MAQQRHFRIQSVIIPAQFAGFSDDPVAGHHDRDRVVSVGHAHGAHGLGVADPVGNIGIGDRFAVGNLHQGLPNQLVEVRRAAPIQFYLKLPALAGEVFRQLALADGYGVGCFNGGGNYAAIFLSSSLFCLSIDLVVFSCFHSKIDLICFVPIASSTSSLVIFSG